jgi:hypothetical protein
MGEAGGAAAPECGAEARGAGITGIHRDPFQRQSHSEWAPSPEGGGVVDGTERGGGWAAPDGGSSA